MKENDRYVQNIILKALAVILIESILIFVIFGNNFFPLFFGLLLGGFVNIAFFYILYRNIIKAMDKTESQAKKYMTMTYTLRYILSAVVLFVTIKSDYLNVFTCFIGLLTIKLTFYINNLISLFGKNNSIRKDGKDGH